MPPSYAPYADSSVNAFYDLLFCDDVALYKNSAEPPAGYPWDTLFAVGADVEGLRRIIADPRMEARVKLLAYNQLRAAGEPADQRQLFGVIVEVSLEEGLDVVAAYADGTARYLNYTGKAVFWDGHDDAVQVLIREMLEAGLRVADRLGPIEGARPAHPATGQLRISFLLSDGLYVGEASTDAVFRDELAGPIVRAAMALMWTLVERAG